MRHAALLLLTAACLAADDEVPVVGQPADLPFSGAVARFARVDGEFRVPFAVRADAAPTRLEVEAPLTLTLTARAAGPVVRPPRGIDPRQLPAFSHAFHIEPLTEGDAEAAGPGVWRWRWRLRPRRAGAAEIPGLPFVFYNPDLQPPEKGFQVLYTDPIAVRVESAERVGLVVEWPATVTAPPDAAALAVREPTWRPPGAATLAALLLGPPAACAAWFLLWRRLYPDAARQTRQRRSRAARRALRALAQLNDTPRRRAEQVADAVAGYLRDRLDLTPTEPTPAEAAALLRRRGFADDVADRAAQLLRGCDAGRFRPDAPDEADLPEAARRLIEELEEQPCPSSL